MTIKVPVRPIPALEETVLNCVHNHMAAIYLQCTTMGPVEELC